MPALFGIPTRFISDDNTGPVICEDTGLNLERLEAYVRISTEKSVTFTCTVVGGIPAKLSWYKNNVVRNYFVSFS